MIVGFDSFVYNAGFDVAANESQPAGKSPSLTQVDIRISLGIRVPIVGL